ncbi:GNAT family N-acetyltransferase [Shewanella mangrovi]|uniref:GNAT family N-acetyltransferase n=1 Tax=Shewanella mangrovi TaxID=1515746 RepID=UPI000691FB69|nr:GNAT family N-acetyltransferase [Shewanella mangrovi]
MHARQVDKTDATKLSDYFMRNQAHFRRWDPLRPHNFHSVANWQQRLNHLYTEPRNEYWFALEFEQRIIAHCALSNIVQGPFQACFMGYGIDAEFEGQGLMPTLCHTALEFAFTRLSLHRVMANYIPCNHRSAALLNKLGFEKEGLAKEYLCINGEWQDHVLTSLLAKHFQIHL